MDRIDDLEEDLPMDISALIPITEYLIEIKRINPQIKLGGLDV